METLEKIDFTLKVTKVLRGTLDKLIDLAESERTNSYKNFAISLTDRDGDVDAFHSIIDAPKIAFSLYALAIVHCYSIVENNRKLICLKIPEINDDQRKKLYTIKVVDECLREIGIDHKKIKCYNMMDEFRLVNNAIKHNRYNLSTYIIMKNKKEYDSDALRKLYSIGTRHLEIYLTDLCQCILKRL